jgi:hypothetical protein
VPGSRYTPRPTRSNSPLAVSRVELGDVHVLRAHQRQLGLVLHRVQSGIAQQRNQGHKELRPYHVHLRIAVRDIDDAAVVQLALWLNQGHQHRVLARLFSAVLVQFFQKIFVPFLGRRFIALVLHLKHDGDDLGARLVRVAKNVVALAAGAGVVVFLKMRPLKGGGTNAVELDFAVLLQRFTDHLGR